jgi:hypothetical protein
MASTYYIKVYYIKKDQQQPEIRRLTVRYSLLNFFKTNFVFFIRSIFHRKMMLLMNYKQKLHHSNRIIN